MDKDTQNKIWDSLSEDIQNQIKEEYTKISTLPRKELYELGCLHTYENTFGIHNLTIIENAIACVHANGIACKHYDSNTCFGCSRSKQEGCKFELKDGLSFHKYQLED